jgi:hypothetical protein
LPESKSSVETGRAVELLREVTQLFRLPTAVKLQIIDAPITPMLWAVPGNPAIILPRQLADSLSDDGLRSILAHELAHFVRRDHWANWFALLVTTLFWWNPIVWFARRQFTATAETCCDALALDRLCVSRKSYATTLLTVVDSLTSTTRIRSAMCITFGEVHSLKRRFELIAEANVKAQVTTCGWILLAIGMACLTLMPARAQESSDPSLSPLNNGGEPVVAEVDEAPAPSDSTPMESKDSWIYHSTREQIRNSFRSKAGLGTGRGKTIGLIGGLANSREMKKVLPLAEEQARAITKLNSLVCEARARSWLTDAEYLDRDPADYKVYAARNEARRRDAIEHAKRLVTTGLLTEAQAAFVTHRDLRSRQWSTLYSKNVQELLGITESQKKKLEEVEYEYYKDFSKQEFDSGVKGVLTPSQLEKWTRLAAERTLPAEPPDLPSSAKPGSETPTKLENQSLIFRALSESLDAIGLSDNQKRLLGDLTEIAHDGLLWIRLRKPNLPASTGHVPPNDLARTKFLRHVEQFALLGILTEQQAERVLHAQTTKQMSMLFRDQTWPGNRVDDYLAGIGSLTRLRVWKEKLFLTKAQAEALNKLDKLVWEAHLQSWHAGADYLDTNPADYQEFIRRSHARRRGNIAHAESMVAVGLLTELQAAPVIQNTLSARRYWLNYLRDKPYLQDLVGITAEQQARLVRLGEGGRAQRAQLNWFPISNTPAEDKAFNDRIAEIQKATDAGIEDILTKDQMEILNRLAADLRSPAKQPDFFALSEDEAATIKFAELSPTFRILAKESEALQLSDDQKKLLKELQEVVRDGVFWIRLRTSSQKPEVQAKFLNHAEQVVLQGILTQFQADQLQGAIKKN